MHLTIPVADLTYRGHPVPNMPYGLGADDLSDFLQTQCEGRPGWQFVPVKSFQIVDHEGIQVPTDELEYGEYDLDLQPSMISPRIAHVAPLQSRLYLSQATTPRRFGIVCYMQPLLSRIVVDPYYFKPWTLREWYAFSIPEQDNSVSFPSRFTTWFGFLGVLDKKVGSYTKPVIDRHCLDPRSAYAYVDLNELFNDSVESVRGKLEVRIRESIRYAEERSALTAIQKWFGPREKPPYRL